ncbi:unnamed protein product [Allacma fusca]|uniref:Uncharacterized protein n=1 Tax=Allacma fusca TaxID=39272 RepID=A0A8J2L7F3_9HEXA|nr:unnamed protein product [Allacma fusca]
MNQDQEILLADILVNHNHCKIHLWIFNALWLIFIPVFNRSNKASLNNFLQDLCHQPPTANRKFKLWDLGRM